jgi:hypothetical protein
MGKIKSVTEHEDHMSVEVKYDDGWFQGASFDLERKDILKERFPKDTKVNVIIKDQIIYGLVGPKGQFVMDYEWKKKYDLGQKRKAEEYAKEYKKKMLAIPRYRYESKYQFPDDVNIYGGNLKEDGEGYRNSAHLSVSRGMEYLEDKNPDDFIQKTYKNIGGISEDNKNMDKLKDHINTCVKKELGNEWGHSGMSMILAAGNALEARKRGWDNYIAWVRSWKE